MIAGWLDLIVWFFLDIRDIIKFTEYKKFDVEKEDGDMENINYEGKTADDKVDQSRKSSLNWMGNQRSYIFIYFFMKSPTLSFLMMFWWRLIWVTDKETRGDSHSALNMPFNYFTNSIILTSFKFMIILMRISFNKKYFVLVGIWLKRHSR